MVKILTYLTFMTLVLSSCVPKQASQKAKCGSGEVFEEVTRSCVPDTTERMPIATTTTINLTEDDPETSFTLSISDPDGDEPIACTLTNSSDPGLYSVLNTQGVRYKVTDQSATQLPNFIFLNIRHSATITPGNEAVYSSSSGATVDIDVLVYNGSTTSQMIATAVNAHDFSGAGIDLDATVTAPFTFQQEEVGSVFQAGECGCTNGVCSVTVHPVAGFVGVTTFDYYVSDPDGDSLTRTMFATISNFDDAPTTVDKTGITAFEDTAQVITFTYGDWDDADFLITGEVPSACTISNLDSNLNITSPCVCGAGVCSVTIQGDTNYPNPPTVATPTGTVPTFDFFDYTVTVNGQVSNVSTVSGTFTGVNDLPDPQDITVNATEPGDNSVNYVVNFTLPDAIDVETATGITYDNPISTAGANIVLTGCLDGTASVNCTATILGNYEPASAQTIQYTANDGTGTSSTVGVITFNITATNDVPLLPGTTWAMNQAERPDFESETFAVTTLDSATDEEGGVLTYFLTDASGSILTATSTSLGTLEDCLSIGNASGSTDLDCNFTTSNGDLTGDFDFYYKACDDGTPVACSDPQAFRITITPSSDYPTVCKYTEFNLEKGKTDCGISGCIGDGAPTLTPSSHTTAEPVVYFDKQSGHCYKSTGVSSASWEQVLWYLPSVKVSEQEVVRIENILLNEGGDSSEDSEVVEVEVNYQDTAPNKYEQVGTRTMYTNNPNLVHFENLTFIYDYENDGVIDTAANDIEDTVDDVISSITFVDSGDALDGRLAIELIPMAGQTGTASVTFSFVDTATVPLKNSVSFDLEVLPRSIKHNGWNKVVAKGIKTNILNQALEKNSTCSYSKAKCNGGAACISTSTADPNGSVSADFAGAIYRSGNDTCYYASAAGSSNWVSFDSFCNITEVPVDDPNTKLITTADSYCGSSTVGSTSAACIGSGEPDATPSKNNTFYYNTGTILDGEKCWVYRNNAWKKYRSTTEVTLGWESFTVTGSGSISGFNLYRRVAGSKFDFNSPINIDTISSFDTEYVDNGTNSKSAPVPNTLYEYELKPIITDSGEDLEATSTENYAKIKILSPPDNFVFAHRWMLNKKMCDQISSPTSPEYNYICPYEGYDQTSAPAAYSSSSYVYDIGNDLLINRFEMGCPYSNSGCTTYDGSCIDNHDPNNNLDGVDGDYYYNRSTATCFVKTGGEWFNDLTALTTNLVYGTATTSSLNNADDGGLGAAAYLPPISSVTATAAEGLCNTYQLGEKIEGFENDGSLSNSGQFKLPTRKQQIAYSQWDITSSFSQSDAAVREEGLAINSASKCNSSSASGIDFAYTDASLPPSGTFYSIPGTATSGIRSVYTGSEQTNLCESFVGLQDAIGNVAEWTSTAFTTSNAGSEIRFEGPVTNLSTGANAPFSSVYTFDGDYGPCRSFESLTCDSGSVIDYNMEGLPADGYQYFSLVVGLPLQTTTFDNETYVSVISTFLRDDSLTLGSTFFGDSSTYSITGGEKAHIVAGGGYTDGSGAGVYTIELEHEDRVDRSDIGFRCVMPLSPLDYK